MPVSGRLKSSCNCQVELLAKVFGKCWVGVINDQIIGLFVINDKMHHNLLGLPQNNSRKTVVGVTLGFFIIFLGATVLLGTRINMYFRHDGSPVHN